MFEIIVDDTALPLPDKDGYSFTPQHIWSQNAGRATSTGTFVGDIVAKKYTVTLKYSVLTAADLSLLWAIANGDAPFHLCRFPIIHPDRGRYYYMADPTFTARICDHRTGAMRYTGVTVEFIQK